jgi:hypothetical protein
MEWRLQVRLRGTGLHAVGHLGEQTGAHSPALDYQAVSRFQLSHSMKFWLKEPGLTAYWDGILGHQFDNRLESFASCYSQSLLLTDFRENHTLLWSSKTIQKIQETRQLESIHQLHFVEWKMWAETRQKLVSEKTQAYAPKPLLKMPFKNSISISAGIAFSY